MSRREDELLDGARIEETQIMESAETVEEKVLAIDGIHADVNLLQEFRRFMRFKRTADFLDESETRPPRRVILRRLRGQE